MEIDCEETIKNRILLRGKVKGDIYEPLPEADHYRNLSTGQEGLIASEVASKYLSVPIRLNNMQMKNPDLAYLIDKLGLAFRV